MSLRNRARRVGWVPFSDPHIRSNVHLADTYLQMRWHNVVQALAAWSRYEHELYEAGRAYDIVVFLKQAFSQYDEAEELFFRLQKAGSKAVFEVNVNYYDIWGHFPNPGLKPTPRHREHALRLTSAADTVVASSSYTAFHAAPLARRLAMIPDNVDLGLFRGRKNHIPDRKPVIGWCGHSSKAYHLDIAMEALAGLIAQNKASLLLISDRPVDLDMHHIFRMYDYRRFPKDILDCDIAISPKVLANSYDMGHTEFKITTFMSMGVPVVASPQPSYLEAIRHGQDGFIAQGSDDWRTMLAKLVDDVALRQRLGERAALTVARCYTPAMSAARYVSVFDDCLGGRQ